MSRGVGIISAVLLYKKNPNYKTKLQKLHKELELESIKQTELYQFPLKLIFSITIIAVSMCLLGWIKEACRDELLGMYARDNSRDISAQEDFFEMQVPMQVKSLGGSGNQVRVEEELEQLVKVIFYLRVAGLVFILAMVLNLKIVVLRVYSQPKSLRWTSYSLLEIKEIFLEVSEIDRVQIHQEGEHRFSNCSYFYSLKLVRNDPQSKALTCEPVLQRSSIFHARQSAIYLTRVLGAAYDPKIYKRG